MKFIKRLNIFLNKPKVFCIGMNKTGTSTMTKIFKELNFRVAPQIKQEKKKLGKLKVKMKYLKLKNFVGNIIFFKICRFLREIFIKILIKYFLKVNLF